MLLQIHDELVFEAPPDEVDDVAALVVEEMTTRLEKDLKKSRTADLERERDVVTACKQALGFLKKLS